MKKHCSWIQIRFKLQGKKVVLINIYENIKKNTAVGYRYDSIYKWKESFDKHLRKRKEKHTSVTYRYDSSYNGKKSFDKHLRKMTEKRTVVVYRYDSGYKGKAKDVMNIEKK